MYTIQNLPPREQPAARAAHLRALIGADGQFAISTSLAFPAGKVWIKGDKAGFGTLPEGGAPTIAIHLKWLDEDPIRVQYAARVAAAATARAVADAERKLRVARETPTPAFAGVRPALEGALDRLDGLRARLDEQGNFTLPCGQTVPSGTVWIDEAGRVAARRFAGARLLLDHLRWLEGLPRVARQLEARASANRAPARRRGASERPGPLDALVERTAPRPPGGDRRRPRGVVTDATGLRRY